MNKEHLRQLRNHDIEMLHLKQEIKMFNITKKELANEMHGGAKLKNRPSTVELIRLVPNKMTRSRTFAPGAVEADDKTQRGKSIFPQLQLDEKTRDNTRQNSKYEQTVQDSDSKDEGNRRRGWTNDDQVAFRRDRRNSYLDKPAENSSSGQHILPELPKHLQRYDHRQRPTDDSRMNGTFKTRVSATPLSMVHSIAWLSFRERQNDMNSTYTPENEDDDDVDDAGDRKKEEQNDKNQSSNDASLKVEKEPNLTSASDSALYSSRYHTGMIDEEEDDDDIPAYRSQYLSYYNLNRSNVTDVKKTENDLMNMMTRSKIKFGQGRHIAARIERRRLLRSWNARSLPTAENMMDEG